MLKQLLQKEQQSINAFFEKIDLKEAEIVFESLLNCKGVIFLCGVGKSGYIAEKIAMTMTSTGTKALYISPLNALHGDIGIVSKDDVFIFLSKSGESEELMQLIPALRNRQVQIIGLVSNPTSRLAKAADLHVHLPLENELCPFDMAPTTSAAIQLIFGDVLAIALMQKKEFGLSQYFQNHPAGRIGKRLSLKVEDLMVRNSDLPLCNLKDKIVEVLVELSDKKCGCVLVVDEEFVLQGIFTDGDLRRALQKHGSKALEMTMQEVMISRFRFTTADTLAFDAMKSMEGDQKNAITVLPVLNDNKLLVGLIRLHDLVQSGL